MLYKPSVSRACISSLKIPVVMTFIVSVSLFLEGRDIGTIALISSFVFLLLYAPLLGLIYFESKFSLEVKDEGFHIKTSDFDKLIPWNDISSVQFTGDIVVVSSLPLQKTLKIPYIEKDDQEKIYKSHFDHQHVKPSTSIFKNAPPPV